MLFISSSKEEMESSSKNILARKQHTSNIQGTKQVWQVICIKNGLECILYVWSKTSRKDIIENVTGNVTKMTQKSTSDDSRCLVQVYHGKTQQINLQTLLPKTISVNYQALFISNHQFQTTRKHTVTKSHHNCYAHRLSPVTDFINIWLE